MNLYNICSVSFFGLLNKTSVVTALIFIYSPLNAVPRPRVVVVALA